jgi:sulfite reductase alpha subunit-like flavoprotein
MTQLPLALRPAYALGAMNAAIIYESLTGNTKKTAHLIAAELAKAGVNVSVSPITNVDYQALAVADLVIVGTWTDGMILVGQRPGRAARLAHLPVIDRKRCLVYITYAVDPGKTLQKLTKIMEQRGANVLGGMAIKRNNLEGGARDFVARLLDAIPA